MTTDQLAAAFLASLEADAAEVKAIADRTERGFGANALHAAAQALIKRIAETTGFPLHDARNVDRTATFAAGLQWVRDSYGSKRK
jgi:hypothetical protein